ncbi:MAG: hypothetical protein ACK50A_00035 [Sphingobacteriaceae bacterium]|jgi:Tfp pilus assembly protein PilN
MFFDKLIPKKLLIKQEVCSVEAISDELATTYHYTVLKSKGSKLEIAFKGSVKDLVELPKQVLKGKIPIVLVINGKGVIIKKVDQTEQDDQTIEQTVEQNLPAINKEDFYVQVFKQQNSAFIALCRKELVDHFISEFSIHKYELAGLLIGVPALIGLQPLWDSFNTIKTSLYDIELSNGSIDKISIGVGGDHTLSIDGLTLHKENVLGFAAGLSYLMQNKVAANVNASLEDVSIKHTEKNKLKLIAVVSVSIAFVVALTNVIFYTGYFEKNNTLETELSLYQSKYDEVNKLLSDYQSKKDLIEDVGIFNKNKISEYADKIAASIPEEVTLTQMYFNPQKEDIESEDSLVCFEAKNLRISGNCNKSLVINEWLNVLKMQDYIKDVSLLRFTYSKEGVLPNFEIKVITK